MEGPQQLDLSDKVHIISTNPRKLVDELFQHIMSIQDPKLLEYVSNMLKNTIICIAMVLSFLTFSSQAGMGAELQTISNRLEF
jgi:hypothetical protein